MRSGQACHGILTLFRGRPGLSALIIVTSIWRGPCVQGQCTDVIRLCYVTEARQRWRGRRAGDYWRCRKNSAGIWVMPWRLGIRTNLLFHAFFVTLNVRDDTKSNGTWSHIGTTWAVKYVIAITLHSDINFTEWKLPKHFSHFKLQTVFKIYSQNKQRKGRQEQMRF